MRNVQTLKTPQDAVSRHWIREDAVIKISDLRLRTYIGFNPEELSKLQDVIINCELHYKADSACKTDDEATALNYKIVTKEIIRLVEQGRFRLLEKLAEDLLSTLMDCEQATRASVRVDKPHALRFADSVSVTLSARRA